MGQADMGKADIGQAGPDQAPKRKFGPDRRELKLRIAISIFGLVLLGAVVWIHGIANSAALVEVFGIGIAMFGGSMIWSLRKLIKGDHADGL